MSIPGWQSLIAPHFSLTAWNALPDDTKATVLASKGAIIATVPPGLLEFPEVTYLFSDWVKLDAVKQQSMADMTGGVGLTNG